MWKDFGSCPRYLMMMMMMAEAANTIHEVNTSFVLGQALCALEGHGAP